MSSWPIRCARSSHEPVSRMGSRGLAVAAGGLLATLSLNACDRQDSQTPSGTACATSDCAMTGETDSAGATGTTGGSTTGGEHGSWTDPSISAALTGVSTGLPTGVTTTDASGQDSLDSTMDSAVDTDSQGDDTADSEANEDAEDGADSADEGSADVDGDDSGNESSADSADADEGDNGDNSDNDNSSDEGESTTTTDSGDSADSNNEATDEDTIETGDPKPADAEVRAVGLADTKASPGDDIRVTIRVQNVGEQRLPTHRAAWFLSTDKVWDDEDPKLCELVVDPLDAGEVIDHNVDNCPVPSDTEEGTYWVLGVSDPTEQLDDEPDRGNNVGVSVRSIEIAASGPDVSIGRLRPSDANATYKPGDVLPTEFDLINSGDIDVLAGLEIELYLSTDKVLDASDGVLCLGETLDPADAGMTTPFLAECSVPTNQEAGNYWILAYADPNEKLAELDETNNFAVSALLVTIEQIDPPQPHRRPTAVHGFSRR